LHNLGVVRPPVTPQPFGGNVTGNPGG
jgi:hypothetical protein